VLQTIDPATLAALKANPDNPAAQARALSELSGVPAADVEKVIVLGAAYTTQLETATAIDPATQRTLGADPTSKAAGAKAVGEIAAKFGIPPSAALARLQALGKVPATDLALLQADGAKVQLAATRLKSVSSIPPADIAYLSANGTKVANAHKDNPGQWQTWWWTCFACQAAFLAFVFLLTGFWSPRRAREAERRHEAMAQRELAQLRADEPGRA
jgi:MFS transporter, ACS family, D-galactonate transporter